MRPIDADNLLDRVTSMYFDLKFFIEEEPTLDVKPVIKGKWIYEENDWFTNYRCSVCKEVFCGNDIGVSIESIYHFCPNCGADMKEVEE